MSVCPYICLTECHFGYPAICLYGCLFAHPWDCTFVWWTFVGLPISFYVWYLIPTRKKDSAHCQSPWHSIQGTDRKKQDKNVTCRVHDHVLIQYSFFVCLSPICQSFRLTLYLSVRLPICLTCCQSVWLTVCLFVCTVSGQNIIGTYIIPLTLIQLKINKILYAIGSWKYSRL